MTTTPPETTPADPADDAPEGQAVCGCCGGSRPVVRLSELGTTAGVYICARCAWWAAGRLSARRVMALDPRVLRNRRRGNPRRTGSAR